MKMYFSKLAKVLLAGVAIVAVGCTDFGEDIDNLNAKIDNDIVAGMIEPLQADLEKAVADLEAAQAALKAELTTKHDADVKTLKDADAALDGKIAAANQSILDLQAALAAEKAALEAEIDALETALAAAKQEAKDADAALEAKLVGEITALETELLAKVTELQNKHDKDIADLKKIVDDNKAAADAQFKVVADQVAALQLKDTELEGELAKQAKAIADLDKKVDANYKELSETIEAVRKNLQEQVYANKAAIDANKASIKATADALKTLTDDVRALEQKVYGIEGDLVAHLEEYANYKALVAGKLAAMQAAHDALVARVEALENEIIPAMKAQIAENAKLAGENAAEIAKNAALFEQYKQAAQQTYEQLLAADAKLAESIALLGGDIEDVNADLQSYKATIEDELAEHYAAFEQFMNDNDQRISKVVADVNAKYAELIAKHNAQEAVLNKLAEDLKAEAEARAKADEALHAYIQQIDERVIVLEGKVGKLEREHAALAEEFAAHKAAVLESIEDLKAADLALDGRIKITEEWINKTGKLIYDELSKLITRVNNIDKQIADLQKDLTEGLEQAAEDLAAAVTEIKAQIAGMVQSLVYVPEYTDGLATINYAVIGAQEQTILEGYSTMTYQVYPAEVAKKIALLPIEEKVALFSFDGNELLVRNAWVEKPLTVVDVVADETKEGALIFTVKANLGERFYVEGPEGEMKNIAVSLHLAVEDTDLSSCYTGLIAAAEPMEIGVNIYQNKAWRAINGMYNLPQNGVAADIEYIDLVKEVQITRDHLLGFTLPGEEKPLTIEEVKAKYGYELEVAAPEVTVEYTQGVAETDLKSVFSVLDEYTNGYGKVVPAVNNYGYNFKVVKLAKVDADAVGASCLVKYFYTVYGSTLSCGGKANITPIQTKVALDAVAPIVWNYVADAEQDAVALNGGDANYARTAVKLALNTEEGTNTLPEDTKVEDLILSGAPASIEVMADGAVVEGVVASLNGNEAEGYTLALSNFEWDTDYTVTLVYKLSHLQANVTVKVNTVDRKRGELVKVEKAYDGYVFSKDYAFAAFDGVAPEMAINSVYTDVAALYDLTGIEEAAYLKEVFVEKAPFAVEDVIAPAATLDYLFNADGDAVSVAYAYDAWTEIPMEVTYTKTLNLWYGQDVELVVKVIIAKPTIYNLVYSNLYVKNGANCDGTGYESHALISGLFSSVYPFYDPDLKDHKANGAPLAGFDTQKVDMDKAFNIVDENGIMSDEAIAAAGLVAEFELEKTYDFSKYNAQFADDSFHRVLKFDGNKLTYNADVCHAEVDGHLYILNSNGSKMELETNFDTKDEYKNYVVQKYDPIMDPVVLGAKYATAAERDQIKETPEIDIEITSAKEYVLNPLLCIELKDWRNGFKNFDLIDRQTGAWVVGKNAGSSNTNGFANGRDVRDIYKLNLTWDESAVPAELRKVIYMTEDNKVVFDNTAEQILVEPFDYTVTLTITSPWGTHKAPVTFRFYQGYGNNQ